MEKLTFEVIREITGGKLIGSRYDDGREISAVVWDSRQIVPGCLFLCIKGEHFDGHDFAAAAVSDGAAGVLCEEKIPGLSCPSVIVTSVLEAAQKLAAFYRKALGITVVGVVGSVGKTSTKELIAAALRKRYRVSKTRGNYNNEWGVPFTVFALKDTDEVAVIEMGVSNFGEMNVLASITEPDIVVMTNIGQSHIEFFGSRDGILKAKSEVFNHMNPDAHAVINADDDKLITIRSAGGKRPEYYGLGPRAETTAVNIVMKGLEGSEFDAVVRRGGGNIKFHAEIKMPGRHMIYNALAAIQVAIDLDVPILSIKEGLKMASSVEGRNNIIRTERFTIIDDCYNASPTSVASSVDLLQYAEGRKVAILGDMLELGADSDKYHFKTGQYVGKTETDVIICVGELCEKMYMGARFGGDHDVRYFKTTEELKKALPSILEDGDTILLKASNALNFKELLSVIKNLKKTAKGAKEGARSKAAPDPDGAGEAEDGKSRKDAKMPEEDGRA